MLYPLSYEGGTGAKVGETLPPLVPVVHPDATPWCLAAWIEHTYNRRRRQRSLGKLTPIEFELAFTPARGTRRGMISHNHRQPKAAAIAMKGPAGWLGRQRSHAYEVAEIALGIRS
jgi:hypothetical protein